MPEEQYEMPALLPEAGNGSATGTCEDETVVNPLRMPVNGEQWIVVRTRPRCEKKLEEVCGLKHMSVYLPLSAKTHSYGGRERTFSSPLFPGYVFSLVNPDQFRWIQQNRFTAEDSADRGPGFTAAGVAGHPHCPACRRSGPGVSLPDQGPPDPGGQRTPAGHRGSRQTPEREDTGRGQRRTNSAIGGNRSRKPPTRASMISLARPGISRDASAFFRIEK